MKFMKWIKWNEMDKNYPFFEDFNVLCKFLQDLFYYILAPLVKMSISDVQLVP